MQAKLFAPIALLALAILGCDQVVDQPIAFPKRAYLGETVSVAIDTDASVPLPGGKAYTLSRENVRIQLWDQITNETTEIVPRAVALGTTPLATTAGEADGASEVSIAVFDLPTTLPPGFSPLPAAVWIVPLFFPGLTEINPLMYPTLEILGPPSQGEGATTFFPSPPEFAPPAIEARLEPLPALRVMAKQAKFPSAWAIGSIQFEVAYPTSLVANPRAYAKTTVARAFAHAEDLSPGRARTMLVDPLGLRLRDSGTAGPFVDIVFDQSAPFEAAAFDIENLLVTDLNGTPLVDRREAVPDDSETYFTLYVRANQ
jgi:hypothetical protein